MKGHVTKKGSVYYVVLELERGPDGKRQQKWLNVRKELGLSKPANKANAEMLLVNKLKELQDGVYIRTAEMTVAELFERWVQDYGKANWRETTLSSYQTFIDKHIIPALGNIPLAKLKPLHLQQFYTQKMNGGRADGKPGGLSSRSVRYLHQLLNEALAMAVKWELVNRNVAEAATPPKLVAQRPEAWSKDEMNTFLSFIKGHRLYPLYAMALSTGMRRGELLGLRWQDIDWDNKKLAVRQSLVTTNGKIKVQEPKTASSRRVIDLSDMEVAMLKKQRRQQLEEHMALGKAHSDNLVFSSERGTPINPRNLARHFETARDKAGVAKIPLHGLRHTCATLMLLAGVNPKVVAERLGHSRISTSLDLYSHVLPTMQREAAESIAKYFEI